MRAALPYESPLVRFYSVSWYFCRVMAFAHAFRLMHMDLCGGKPGLCPEMQPIDGALLLRYLRKVKFVGLTKDEFEFDSAGDGPVRYKHRSFSPHVQPGSAALGMGKRTVERCHQNHFVSVTVGLTASFK